MNSDLVTAAADTATDHLPALAAERQTVRETMLGPEELARAEWRKQALTVLTEEQVARLANHHVMTGEHQGQSAPTPFFEHFHLAPPDPVTGFLTGQTRFNTICRVIQHCRDTNTCAILLEGDIANLTGSNRYLGSHAGGNQVFRMATDRTAEGVRAIGPNNAFWRHGGDEFDGLVWNLPFELADAFLRGENSESFALLESVNGGRTPTLARLRDAVMADFAGFKVPDRRNQAGELLFVENAKHADPRNIMNDPAVRTAQEAARAEALACCGIGCHLGAVVITGHELDRYPDVASAARAVLEALDYSVLGAKLNWSEYREKFLGEKKIPSPGLIRLDSQAHVARPDAPVPSANLRELGRRSDFPVFASPVDNANGAYRNELFSALPELRSIPGQVDRYMAVARPWDELLLDSVTGTNSPLLRTPTFLRLVQAVGEGRAGVSFAGSIALFNLKGLNATHLASGANQILRAAATRLTGELQKISVGDVALFRRGPSFDVIIPSVRGNNLEEKEDAVRLAFRRTEEWIDAVQTSWRFPSVTETKPPVDLRTVIHPNHIADRYTPFRGTGLYGVFGAIDLWSEIGEAHAPFALWDYLYTLRAYREQQPPSREERDSFWGAKYVQ